jgi:hypothetical protein
MESKFILVNSIELDIFNGEKGGRYKTKYEIMDGLYEKIEENFKNSIIENYILIPYKEEGDCIFRLVSYSPNIFIYEYETTVS